MKKFIVESRITHGRLAVDLAGDIPYAVNTGEYCEGTSKGITADRKESFSSTWSGTVLASEIRGGVAYIMFKDGYINNIFQKSFGFPMSQFW